MKRIVLALTLVLSASASHGEEPPRIDWKPYAVLASGQAFDVASTRIAIKRGCVKGNRIYRSAEPTTKRLVATKFVVVGAVAVAAAVLDLNGHPKLARWLGYGGGVTGFGVGALNLSANCR